MAKRVIPALLTDAKRVQIYQYGKDGKITVNKRIIGADDLDMVEEILCGNIEIVNDSECRKTVNLCGKDIDANALTALDIILGE